MANLLPVPLDANQHRLVDLDTQPFWDARTYGTSYVDVQWAVDIKDLAVYVVSGTLLVKTKVPTATGPTQPMFNDHSNPPINRKGPAKAFLDAAAAVDAGGGKVQIAAAKHGFVSGDVVVMHGTTYYGTTTVPVSHTLTAGTTGDVLEFSATYHAESIPATAFITGSRPAQYTAGMGFRFTAGIEADVTVCQMAAASGTVVVNFIGGR